ncbi:NmrA family NAD(P)-binding protein [Streptomyces subrutilus]|uniref:NmrA family NAD(P)-binding protein n=1 Tax=Streptomyces subrutilus TaxID=36818 RepID=UPI0033DAF902
MTASPATRTLLVTGSTGNTGRPLVHLLARDGHHVRAATRDLARGAGAHGGSAAPGTVAPVVFDWHEPATHDAALEGADAVYLVPPVGATDPARVMLPFLDRAVRAGVRRAVLLSSSQIASGGPGAGAVHAALPGTFGEWAVLRPSWFMQNFTGAHQHADGIRAEGLITTATGRGRVGFVDADDIAAVAARALTDAAAHDRDWIVTGPQALSYDDVAATLTRVTGRPVRHRAVGAQEMRRRYARQVPDGFAALLAGLDGLIAGGAEDRVTDCVEVVTGCAARSFAEHARAHARALAPRP